MVRNAVADMFAYIATDNREFSHVYIQEIFKVIQVSNFMIIKLLRIATGPLSFSTSFSRYVLYYLFNNAEHFIVH